MFSSDTFRGRLEYRCNEPAGTPPDQVTSHFGYISRQQQHQQAPTNSKPVNLPTKAVETFRLIPTARASSLPQVTTKRQPLTPSGSKDRAYSVNRLLLRTVTKWHHLHERPTKPSTSKPLLLEQHQPSLYTASALQHPLEVPLTSREGTPLHPPVSTHQQFNSSTLEG